MQKHKSLQKQTEKIVEFETWCMGALAGIGRRVQVTYSRGLQGFCTKLMQRRENNTGNYSGFYGAREAI